MLLLEALSFKVHSSRALSLTELSVASFYPNNFAIVNTTKLNHLQRVVATAQPWFLAINKFDSLLCVVHVLKPIETVPIAMFHHVPNWPKKAE